MIILKVLESLDFVVLDGVCHYSEGVNESRAKSEPSAMDSNGGLEAEPGANRL
jgi:hypothetical protein